MYSGFDGRPIRERMDDFKGLYDQLIAERES